MDALAYYVAPFTGAWIEMLPVKSGSLAKDWSHPSRVRGLKFDIPLVVTCPLLSRTLHGCVD